MKRQKRTKFDISNFLTENKITEQSKRLDEKDSTVAYIRYMNKDKGFKEDKKKFKGKNAYEAGKKAKEWAEDNLEKFNQDMIQYESINETKFFVWYGKEKHEVEASSLYDAKKKFIQQNNVPRSKQSTLAIKSAGSMEKGDFRFEDINEEDYDRERDAKAMGYRSAAEADKDNWGKPKKENVNEEIEVFDERKAGGRTIIMLKKNGGPVKSAIFKKKANADKYNRNKQEDLEKLYKLAEKTPFPKAIDESKKGFDIRGFLTENKITEQSKNLK